MAVEPEPPLTLKQRLLADSPIFWKVIGYIGLLLGLIAATIKAQFPDFPQSWLGILAGLSGGMVALPQFAVKDTSALAKPDANLQDYINLAQDLKNQYAEVKASVDASVANVKEAEVPVKAEDIPVVKDIPVVVAVDQEGSDRTPVITESIEQSEPEPPIEEKASPPLRNTMIQQ
jgi:hypothetical protein